MVSNKNNSRIYKAILKIQISNVKSRLNELIYVDELTEIMKNNKFMKLSNHTSQFEHYLDNKLPIKVTE